MKNKIVIVILLILQFSCALRAAVSIDITSPNVGPGSGWVNYFPLSGQYDYVGDTYVGDGKTSIDIVGDATFPASYIQFNDDGSEIAVRIRVNACDTDSIVAGDLFKRFAYIGIDASCTGTIDFFIGAYNPTGAVDAGWLGIYPAHPDALNTADGLTGITDPVARFTPIAGVNYSFMQTQDGSNFSDNPDYFITFKFKVADITNAIAGYTKENVIFTPQTAFTFIAGTASVDNFLTGDVSGVNEVKGPFPPWVKVYGKPISADGTSWSCVIFDSNGGEIGANPSQIPVKTGTSIQTFPEVPAKRNGYKFVGWSRSSLDGDPMANPFVLGTQITRDITVYATWIPDPEGYYPFSEDTVHFDPSGGSWAGGVTFYHKITVDGSIRTLPPIPNPPSDPTLIKNNEKWVFGGWVTGYKTYINYVGGAPTPMPGNNIIEYSGTVNINDQIQYFCWPQLVSNGVNKIYQPHDGLTEYTVYALWMQIPRTGQQPPEIDFYDNIYDNSGQTSFPPQYGMLLYTAFGSTNQKPAFAPLPVTRQGYTFQGWDTRPDGTGTRYLNPYSTTATTTAWLATQFPNNTTTNLYAIWKADNYAMLFLPNNIDYGLNPLVGTPSPESDFGYVMCPVTTFGITYPNYPSPNPSLYGYTFMGWNTEPKGTGFGVDPYIRAGDLIRFSLFSPPDSTVIINGDTVHHVLKMYAQWQVDSEVPPITARVTFDAMGGNHNTYLSPTNPYYLPGDEITQAHQLLDLTATNGFLPFVPIVEWRKNIFPDGEPYYVFEGWSFDNTPNRTVADPPVVNWRSDPRFMNGDITVYAVWKKNYYQNIIVNRHLIQRIRVKE